MSHVGGGDAFGLGDFDEGLGAAGYEILEPASTPDDCLDEGRIDSGGPRLSQSVIEDEARLDAPATDAHGHYVADDRFLSIEELRQAELERVGSELGSLHPRGGEIRDPVRGPVAILLSDRAADPGRWIWRAGKMRFLKQLESDAGWAFSALLRDLGEIDQVKLPATPHRRPVLLLHGFASAPRMLAPLERSLRRLGREVIRVPLSPGRDDLRESARQVQRLLEELSTQAGFEYADAVGHSMGGLVATYVLKQLDRGRRLRNVVTLGTPHRGTPLAALGVLAFGSVSRAVWQMLPGSEFICSLGSLPVPRGSSLISISGESDWVVPQSFSKFQPAEGAESHTIGGCSHIGLLVDRSAHALVRVFLGKDAPETIARAA